MTNRKNEEHGSVTPYQMSAVIVGAVIGVGVLAFPRIIIEQAGTCGPLATLLGAVPVLVSWLALVRLGKWYPGRTPAEYAPRLITRPLGWLYVFILLCLLVAITALTLREFGAVLKSAVLPRTPLEVTVGLGLLSVAWFVRYDVQVFARVFEVFFPLMVVPLTIIGVLSLKNAHISYLMPVMGESLAGCLKGATLASVGYVAIIIAPFLLPSLNLPNRAVKAGFWGIGLSCFVYLLAVSATLSVFGPEEIKHLIWPTFELVKSTTVPGFILERLESAFIGIWVAAVFTTVAATYYTVVVGAAQLFRLGDHKVMVLPLVPVVYMVAMLPPDVHALYRVVTALGLVGVVLIVLMPLAFVAVAWLRHRGRPANAQRHS